MGGEKKPDPLRWWALAVLSPVQFVLVSDATVVNPALPSIPRQGRCSGQNNYRR